MLLLGAGGLARRRFAAASLGHAAASAPPAPARVAAVPPRRRHSVQGREPHDQADRDRRQTEQDRREADRRRRAETRRRAGRVRNRRRSAARPAAGQRRRPRRLPPRATRRTPRGSASARPAARASPATAPRRRPAADRASARSPAAGRAAVRRCCDLDQGAAPERQAAGERLERHHRERVAVAGRRRRLAERLLGRDVGRRAEQLAVAVELSSNAARAMPKSATTSRSRSSNSRLRGFTSRCTTPFSCAKSSAEAASPSQRSDLGARRGRPAAHALRERPPARCSITMNGRPPVLADVVDRDHVRVARQGRGRARLALEARHERGLLGELLRQHLDRHVRPARRRRRPRSRPCRRRRSAGRRRIAPEAARRGRGAGVRAHHS